MSLFHRSRNNEPMGKGSDKIVSLVKEFEVLNCTPIDYSYTPEYAKFLAAAEEYFSKIVQKTSIDELNCDMFDNYIQSMTDKMKSSAKEQYTYHIYTISHHRGLVDGELVKAEEHRTNLKNDLSDIEEDISRYKKIKNEFNIY